MNRVYRLDGEVVALAKLCRTEHWPRDVVFAAMRGAQPPQTMAQLRAVVVAARSRIPAPRPATLGQRRFVAHRILTPLTNQAQIDG